MIASLHMVQLVGFEKALKRDVIIDGRNRPVPMGDREFLQKVIMYGNAYLDRAIVANTNPDVILWFDISFNQPGDKAFIGMTWAYNARHPRDEHTGMDYFWRMWTEVQKTDEHLLSIEAVQEQMAAYSLLGIS